MSDEQTQPSMVHPPSNVRCTNVATRTDSPSGPRNWTMRRRTPTNTAPTPRVCSASSSDFNVAASPPRAPTSASSGYRERCMKASTRFGHDTSRSRLRLRFFACWRRFLPIAKFACVAVLTGPLTRRQETPSERWYPCWRFSPQSNRLSLVTSLGRLRGQMYKKPHAEAGKQSGDCPLLQHPRPNLLNRRPRALNSE